MTYPSMAASPPMIPLPQPHNPTTLRSFTPEYVDSYNFCNRPVLEKPEVLSPLPDSFYDAYPSSNSSFTCAGVMPVLTPPASETYPPANSNLINWHSEQRKYYDPVDFLCYHPMPQPPLPSPSACYSPGCSCQHVSMHQQQSLGLMSPSTFFDPSPYSIHQRKRHYGKHNTSSRNSLDSSSSSSTSSTIDSSNQEAQKSTLTPRRYKCTLCIKRFTRPSSLATHMHSHTGAVKNIHVSKRNRPLY